MRLPVSKVIIDIKTGLLKRAKKLSGLHQNSDVVNLALEKLVRQKEIETILELKGKIHWEGNLKEMRKDRGLTCGK